MFQRQGDFDAAVRVLQSALRLALLPDLVTFASIEAALESPEVLLPEGAVWRFLPGKTEPTGGLEWTETAFDDASWAEGAVGLGYGDPAAATVLADMRGSYTTVYARRAFELPHPADFTRFILSVRADDGFVVYLNGVEAGRLRAGKAGEPVPFSAKADSPAEEPAAPHEIILDSHLLRPGRNVLALQGLNHSSGSSDFLLAPVLLAEPSSGFNRELVRAFGAAAPREAAGARLAYLDGRLLQMQGKYADAAERFEEAARLEPRRPEPVLRLVECWRTAGDAVRAEALCRSALAEGIPGSDDLWDSWFILSAVHLGRGLKEILASFPPPAAGDAGMGVSSRGMGLRWALEALDRDGRIRLDSGGDGYTSPDGAVWAGDHFVNAGERTRFEGREVAGTDDDPLFQTELWFRPGTLRPPGYRIPLPLGRYRITFHFAELVFREKGKRRFDVLLEGDVVMEGYEPPLGQAERRTFVKAVSDGFLDIIFVHRVDNPILSALEVQREE